MRLLLLLAILRFPAANAFSQGSQTPALPGMGPAPAPSAAAPSIGDTNRSTGTVLLGREALSVLFQASREKNAEVRAAAMTAWGQVGNPAAVGLLKKALKDKSDSVRVEAAFSLHLLGDESGFETLAAITRQKPKVSDKETPIQKLKTMAQERVRIAAIQKLGKIGGEDAVKVFESTVEDPSGAVRDATAIALASVGLDEFEAQFLNALKDDDASVRQAAVKALGEIGTADILGAISQAAADPVGDVRAQAMTALGHYSSDDVAPLLAKGAADVDSRVKAKAIGALAQMSDAGSVDILRQALKDATDLSIELPAITGLARRGQSVDLALVATGLKAKDEDIRRLAITALSQINSAGALDLLKQDMEQDDSPLLRIEAAATLIRRLEKPKDTP